MNFAHLEMIAGCGAGRTVHPQLGPVEITVKAAARRFIARWGNGVLRLTVPPYSSPASIAKALDSMAPRLLARHHTLSYEPGMRMDFDGIAITVSVQSLSPSRTMIRFRLPESHILVGSSMGFADPITIEAVSRAMKRIAFKAADSLLLPRARQLASELGCRPSGWSISRGTHILGQCDSHGFIRLSLANVFLPSELRDYIICHELAHLSEMNHSHRFHEICDRYCNGRERHLIAALRRFSWPILR